MGIVAIVGRPNVGKSSLFNRLIGKKTAIVDDLPGVTRDRLYGEVSYEGKSFYVVDTGGIMASVDGPFTDMVQRQVEVAVKESDLVVFVLDGRDGVTPIDRQISDLLRKVEPSQSFGQETAFEADGHGALERKEVRQKKHENDSIFEIMVLF